MMYLGVVFLKIILSGICWASWTYNLCLFRIWDIFSHFFSLIFFSFINSFPFSGNLVTWMLELEIFHRSLSFCFFKNFFLSIIKIWLFLFIAVFKFTGFFFPIIYILLLRPCNEIFISDIVLFNSVTTYGRWE